MLLFITLDFFKIMGYNETCKNEVFAFSKNFFVKEAGGKNESFFNRRRKKRIRGQIRIS